MQRFSRVPLWALVIVVTFVGGALYGSAFRTGAHAASHLQSGCKSNTTKGVKYTPGPKSGAVTPLPGATKVPAQPGLVLGMITHSAKDFMAIQHAANAGKKNYVWFRVPSQVVRRTLPHYGFKPPINVVSPPKPAASQVGRPLRKAVVQYRNDLYKVYVAQPATHGAKGIWVIVTILRQHLHVGMITRPMSTVTKTQKLVNSGKSKYQFWRRPTQVVKLELPQYGFKPPITIVKGATPIHSVTGRPVDRVVVKWKGDYFNVDVAQPATHGSKGIWVIVTIGYRP